MSLMEGTMEEVWKRYIRVYDKGPNFCWVSNKGRVKNRDMSDAPLSDNGAGYLSFSGGGNRYTQVRVYAHRAVAQLFIDNPKNLPQVNHKDCDKSNNCVDNLEWVERSDNIKHAHAEGRMIKRTSNGKINVLTEEQVIDLYTAVKRDKIGISMKAREMGIARTTASSILNKRSRSDITDKLDEDFLQGG